MMLQLGIYIYMPYYFIGDDAFPLLKRMIKPYKPKRRERLDDEEEVFNYRLSRARRCIENAFGILTIKWGCEKMNCIYGIIFIF